MSQQSVIITNGITDVEAKNISVDGTEQGLVTRPIIAGVDADGYTPTVNPLLVAGTNPDGYVQTLSVTQDGYLNVNATVTTPPDLDAGTPGSAAPSEAAYVAGKDPSGNLKPLELTADGYLKVTLDQNGADIDVNVTNTVNVDLANVSAVDGSTAPAKTVSVGGVDGSGNIQTLSVGSDGYLNVNATVTTPPDLDAGTPGSAAPSEAAYVAGKDPSGNLKPLELTSDGYLKVTMDPAGSAIDVNVTNTVNVDLTNVSAVDGATAPAKTVAVGGVDSLGNLQTLSVGTDGYLNVNATVTTPADLDAGVPGAAAPAEAAYVAGKDPSGNLKPLELTADGYLKVTMDPNGAAIDVNVTNTVNVDLTNVSAPDGTTAPTETVQVGGKDGSGNIQALNVDSDGYLRVSIAAQADYDAGPTGSAVPAQASYTGAKDDSGNLQALEVDGYGNLRVTQGATGSYTYINTASQTVTMKSGAGVFRRVIVGNAGQTAALITFYDNTAGSGTVIAKVNPSNVHGTLEFDIAFTTGLTYVTNAKTPGDVTVTFE